MGTPQPNTAHPASPTPECQKQPAEVFRTKAAALSHLHTAGEIGVSAPTLAVTLVTWAPILKSLNDSYICAVNKDVRSQGTEVIILVTHVCL